MKKFLLILIAIINFALIGCTSEIEIKLNQSGKIDVRFDGVSGVAFSTLIRSASGVQEGEVVFDTKEISYELGKNGFSEVKVNSKKGTDLSISMSDSAKKSSLYTSGVLTTDKSSITAVLSAKKLMDFYNASDDEIVSFLDMLLAPVFNDEILTENEYLETVAAFYGKAAADEIGESNFKITFITPDGKSTVHIIPMVKLLTLNETLFLSNS